MTEKTHRAIVLIGLMGSGKSSVGRVLAGKLGCRYWDSDEELRAKAQTPAQIAHEYGEDALHQRESTNLFSALHSGAYRVLGAAASVALDPAAADELRQPWVVWLQVSVATLVDRLRREPGDRPFLTGDIDELLAGMSSARNPLYAALADQIIDDDELRPEEIADRVTSACASDSA